MEKDFQHITTELISVFAVLDGLCDTHEHEKKHAVSVFLQGSLQQVAALYANAGKMKEQELQTPGDLRGQLRDQLYAILCLIDSIEDEGHRLTDDLRAFVASARNFALRVDANNTLVE